jgi:hypothetical protein
MKRVLAELLHEVRKPYEVDTTSLSYLIIREPGDSYLLCLFLPTSLLSEKQMNKILNFLSSAEITRGEHFWVVSIDTLPHSSTFAVIAELAQMHVKVKQLQP